MDDNRLLPILQAHLDHDDDAFFQLVLREATLIASGGNAQLANQLMDKVYTAQAGAEPAKVVTLSGQNPPECKLVALHGGTPEHGEYHYFVSYIYKGRDGGATYSSATVYMNGPVHSQTGIDSMTDSIKEFLQKEYGQQFEVAILNWRLFD
jgi:hypothetical protein